VIWERATGQQRPIISGATYARYLPTGHIAFAADGVVHVVAFDVDRFEVTSPPVPMIESVMTKSAGAANFAVSGNGTLMYLPGPHPGGRTLVWRSRDGREEPVSGLDSQNYLSVRVSPSGSHLATDYGQPRDVWTYDVARATRSRLTTDRSEDQFPLWTPDGKRIVFTSTRSGSPELYMQSADGSGSATRLFPRTAPGRVQGEAWTRNGAELLLTDTPLDGGNSISVWVMSGQRPYQLPENTSFIEGGAALSPDGKWLAYQSNRSGQIEVYVERYPSRDDRQKVSLNGGFNPRWSSHGRELYFLALGGVALMSVSVNTEPALQVGAEVKLFDGRFLTNGPGHRVFDVMPDGKRFVMIKVDDGGDTTASSMIVVQNWFEEIRRRVPAR
jgi:serine/threonine-protein kinase